MSHCLTFNPPLLTLREPFNVLKGTALKIRGDPKVHVVFRTSFILTCGLPLVREAEFGFAASQRITYLKIAVLPLKGEPQLAGKRQHLCLESFETSNAGDEGTAEQTWSNIRRKGTHITSWIIPIVVLSPGGVFEIPPTLSNCVEGLSLRAGETASLDGVAAKLNPEVKASFEQTVASNSRGMVQEGVMTYVGSSENILRVAIKYIVDNNNSGGSGESTPRSLVERTQTELRVWLHLNHPNIAPLLGYAVHPRTLFVSPFYPNGNVFDFVRNTSAKGPTRLNLIHQIALALEYIHREGFVHGDLKRDNVMVDLHSNAIIIDFGFSLFETEADGHITSVGHRIYQPRELYRTLRKTWRGDVYAYGLLTLEASLVPTYYEIHQESYVRLLNSFLKIATGVKAFEHYSLYQGTYAASEQIMRHHYADLDSGSPLWDIMEGCWRLDPIQRPSMNETRLSLQHLHGGQVQRNM